MIKVEVVVDNNKWKKKIKRENYFFNKVLRFFPKKYKFEKKKIIFSLSLSDNQTIKKLNKKFRKKNKPTDVLSFPNTYKVKNDKFHLGDIIISYNYMNQPKNITNLNFKKKVVKIFIHGFLHLLGHDHKKKSDFIKMQKEENKLFNLLEKKIEKII
tara:strand:- start:188 stop:655 length:468 start_codon:yes stop_codon:yes gene_type:complete